MDYAVIWDDEAIKELGQIVHHIGGNNPIAARKMGDLILEKVQKLRSFPEIGKVFQKLHRQDVREISVPPYRIIYHIKQSERVVRILKVWHERGRSRDSDEHSNAIWFSWIQALA